MRAFAMVSLMLFACSGEGLNSESFGGRYVGTLASVSGYVRHAGAPIEGAVVSLGDNRDTTDGSGLFSLGNLPAGAQKLTIVAQGFAPITLDVEVLLGSNDVGDVELQTQTDCACAVDELCTDGACEKLPYNCNANGCPVKSYCDVDQNACLAGCLSSANCPSDKVCNESKRSCVCADDTHNCFGVCASNTAVASCGQACSPCIAPANAAPTCNGVACDFTCNAGFQRCNGNECCALMSAIRSAGSTGYNMSCLTTTGDEAYCWGNNQYGTIGDGTNLTLRSTPTRVDVEAASVTLGYRFSCALTVGGGVKCWGRGTLGELGNNAASSSLAPVDVFGLSVGATQVSAGSSHACALLADGRIKCWGSNQNGELGNGSTGNFVVKPTIVCTSTTVCTPYFENVSYIAAGLAMSCAVTADRSLYCWGLNSYGRLGLGLPEDAWTTPQHVAGVSNVDRVWIGGSHVCATTTGGSLYCWGDNSVGQLGDGTKIQRNAPVLVVSEGVASVAVGSNHTCVALQGGEVKCWGGNDKNQLGDGTIDNRTTPAAVIGLAGAAVSVTAGDQFSCAILTSGRMQCWGNNTDGQLGNTARGAPSPTPVYVVRDN